MSASCIHVPVPPCFMAFTAFCYGGGSATSHGQWWLFAALFLYLFMFLCSFLYACSELYPVNAAVDHVMGALVGDTGLAAPATRHTALAWDLGGGYK